MTKPYQEVILKSAGASQVQFDLLSAHPKANGFYGARFPLGGIPHAYSLISQQFFKSVIEQEETSRKVRLFEYLRPDWTFHAKGLWYYLPQSSYPIATMVGSPNYGYR